MPVDLTNRTALVTGAGEGIGREHALALARLGARVVINDLNQLACERVADEIGAAGGHAQICVADVSDPRMAQALVAQAVQWFSRLDVVVNNAGIVRDKSFHQMSLQDFDRVLDVHLRGTSYVTHAAWPHMRAQGYGRIVVTTSSSALWGNFGQSNYDAGKLGVIGLMRALCLEGRKRNILINAIAPFAMTRMSDGIFPEELRETLGPQTVTALVAALCDVNCPCSGEIFEVGARRIRRVRMMAGAGIDLQHEGKVEEIESKLPHVLAQSTDQHFDSLWPAFDAFVRVQRSPGR